MRPITMSFGFKPWGRCENEYTGEMGIFNIGGFDGGGFVRCVLSAWGPAFR